jgi:hypothetical protein
MLKHGEVNQLNVFDLRQVHHCPPHFVVVTFDLRTNIKEISDWIYENLSGRFYIGDYFDNSESDPGKVKMQKAVAFELHEEASYFGLFLPNINVAEMNF